VILLVAAYDWKGGRTFWTTGVFRSVYVNVAVTPGPNRVTAFTSTVITSSLWVELHVERSRIGTTQSILARVEF
jgi:hypothetical protein